MKPPRHDEDDEALRRALRATLQEAPPPDAALQARVLAQWRQRHAAAPPPRSAGLLALATRRWLGLAALSASLLTALAWCSRPDPALEELLQPDVLSQMSIGEM